MPISSSIIARLIEAFPDATDDAIKAMARAQGFVSKAWDAGNKPLLSFGSETTQNPFGKFGLQLAEGMTSPLGLASLALSGGAATAGKLGYMGLAKGGLMAEAALNAPSVAQGAYTAATAPTAGGKAAGLVQAGLGTLGAASPARTLRRMNKSLEQAPEMLAAARANGGVSMDPDLGDLGGKPGFAVGGMIAPEGKGTVPLDQLSTEEFQRYIMSNARAMGKPNQFPGVWQDPDTGKAAMDITTRLFDPAEATREGILAGQKAIFDLGKYAERPIMGLPTRTRTAILKGGPESMTGYGSPTRFGSMLGLDPGDIRGLAQAGDQDAISALLRLAQDETGSMGRTIRPTRSQAPGSLRMDAARMHLGYELPEAMNRMGAGEPAIAARAAGGAASDMAEAAAMAPKRQPGFRPPAAMAMMAPGMVTNAGLQSGMIDEETANSDWFKAIQALSAAGMVGGLGMAAVRMKPQPPKTAIARDIATNQFMSGGKLTKKVTDVDTRGLQGKPLDAAISSGFKLYGDLASEATPKRFNINKQRAFTDAGMEGKDWYTNSSQGIRSALGNDPLITKLFAAASTKANPYDNTTRALAMYAAFKLGMPIEEAIQWGGLPAVKKMAREAMTAGKFGERKVNNFAANLGGDLAPVTTDMWGGRGIGFHEFDPAATILLPGKDKLGGIKTKQGGYVDWPQHSKNIGAPWPKPIQEAGQVGAHQTDLFEDVIRNIAQERNLRPAEAQAAHWFGVQQALEGGARGSKTLPHQRLPFGDQIMNRFNAWGLKPVGEEGTLDIEALQTILDAIKRDKALGAGKRPQYGKLRGGMTFDFGQ